MTRQLPSRSACAAGLATLFAVLAIDASATGGGQPPGLAARVEALENQNARQQARIRQLLKRPDVAGKSCPAGLAIVGFSPGGALLCAAPWASGPAPAPQTEFRCIENYDADASATLVRDHLNGPVAASLRETAPLNLAESMTLNGQQINYELRTEPWVLVGLYEVAAPLVEIAAQEPCADAIHATIRIPDLSSVGQAEVDLGLLGSIRRDVRVEGIGLVLDVMVRLRAPELEGLSAGASVDRDVESVNVTLVGGDIDVSIDDATLELILNTIESVQKPKVIEDLIEKFEEEFGLYLLSSLSAPVTVQVVAVP